MKHKDIKYILDKMEIKTAYGQDLKRNLRVYKECDKEKLLKHFDNIEHFYLGIKNSNDYVNRIDGIMTRIKDIRNIITSLKRNNILDEVELFEIKNFSIAIDELKEILKEKAPKIKDIEFISMKKVVKLLNPQDEIVPTFYIYDSYKEELKYIRNKKKDIENKIKTNNDKFPLNDLIKERSIIVLKEKELEDEVKRKLTKELLNYLNIMIKNIMLVGELDLVISKAKLAFDFGAVRPEILDSEDAKLVTKGMINLEVSEYLKKYNNKFTPIDICLKNGVSILTGANMGGKTVALKTIYINAVLFHLGFYVFSNKFSMNILDNIYFVGGELEDVKASLSSFGGEVMALKNVLKVSKISKGLILIDEFAKGTNPHEGRAFVEALCKYFIESNSIIFVSTHYQINLDYDLTRKIKNFRIKGINKDNLKRIKEKINFEEQFKEQFKEQYEEQIDSEKRIEYIKSFMDYSLEKVEENNLVPMDGYNIALLMGLDKDFLDIVKKMSEG